MCKYCPPVQKRVSNIITSILQHVRDHFGEWRSNPEASNVHPAGSADATQERAQSPTRKVREEPQC